MTHSRTTEAHFSGTYPAVLISAIVIAVTGFPLALLAFFLPSPWRYVSIAIVLSATLALIMRTRRISLVVTSNGVGVHNFVHSYWLPWASIEEITPTDRSMLGEGPGERTLEFALRNGSRVHAQATFGPRVRYAAELQAMRRYAGKWNIRMPEPNGTIAP